MAEGLLATGIVDALGLLLRARSDTFFVQNTGLQSLVHLA